MGTIAGKRSSRRQQDAQTAGQQRNPDRAASDTTSQDALRAQPRGGQSPPKVRRRLRPDKTRATARDGNPVPTDKTETPGQKDPQKPVRRHGRGSRGSRGGGGYGRTGPTDARLDCKPRDGCQRREANRDGSRNRERSEWHTGSQVGGPRERRRSRQSYGRKSEANPCRPVQQPRPPTVP